MGIRGLSRRGPDETTARHRQVQDPSYRVFHDIIECLVAALEAKDCYTCGHSSRVADMSLDLARTMGLRGMALEDVHFAAHLHDIGKIGISESILHKPDMLSAQEWAELQQHPVIGYNILCKSRALGDIPKIVLHHHERWDGRGYPEGLSGSQIPLGSRIIALSDAIDAMTTVRPYRVAVSWERCYDEVQLHRGKQFDPAVVEAAELLWRPWANQWKQAAAILLYETENLNDSGQAVWRSYAPSPR
jgi:HD-GYP domain-containing protein (c-di-GMP phosphodiesterase class II)